MSSPDPEAPSTRPEADDPSPRTPNEGIRKALTRYRVMAWATGIWLLVLCTMMVFKYIVGLTYPWFAYIGPAHGVFYMLYVFFALDLGVKVRWPIGKMLGVLAAGTVPLLGIIVEHFRTQELKAQFGL